MIAHKMEIPVPYVRLRIWRVPLIREIVVDDRPGLETGLVNFTVYQHPELGPCWVQLPALPGYSIWEIRPQYLSDRVRWQLIEMLNQMNNLLSSTESSRRLQGHDHRRWKSVVNSLQANHLLLNSEYNSQAFREKYVRVVGPHGMADGLVNLTPEIPEEIDHGGKFQEYKNYLENSRA